VTGPRSARAVPDATEIVGLAAVNALVAFGVPVAEQFQVPTYLGMLQEANVQTERAVAESRVAGERRQIHARVVHRTGGVGRPLETERGAVKLCRNVDIGDDNVQVGDGKTSRCGVKSAIVPFQGMFCRTQHG
jgi:hypothetical protein